MIITQKKILIKKNLKIKIKIIIINMEIQITIMKKNKKIYFKTQEIIIILIITTLIIIIVKTNKKILIKGITTKKFKMKNLINMKMTNFIIKIESMITKTKTILIIAITIIIIMKVFKTRKDRNINLLINSKINLNFIKKTKIITMMIVLIIKMIKLGIAMIQI